jgi:hypothetical protein
MLDGHSVLLGDPLHADTAALGWRGRVELEAPPCDVNLVGVLELGECRLEAALADVAPGTGNIGPDLNFHRNSSVEGTTTQRSVVALRETRNPTSITRAAYPGGFRVRPFTR